MTTKNTNSADEAQIRGTIEAWAEALRSKNADGVVSHQAAGFVLFSLAPPLVSPVDAEGLNAWFSTWQGAIGYEIRDLSITADGDTAFCHNFVRMSGTKIDGEKNDIWFRQTLCLRKIRGAWKFTHQHESVPFYMDGSYRAAVDLTP